MENDTQSQHDVQHVQWTYTTVKTSDLGIQHLLAAFAAIFVTSFLSNFVSQLWKRYQFQLFAQASKCLPIPQASNPFPMPWSLNRKYEIYKASLRGDLFDNHFTRLYSKYGNTHAIVSPFTGVQKGINTIEPENVQCVMASRFDDYRRPRFRMMASQPMLLPGLLTLDGPMWAHWRGMVRTQFTRKKFDANVADSERHMQLAFKAFGSVDEHGWTGEFNLLDHVYRLTMDTVTQFLFGHSAETQTAKLIRRGLLPPLSDNTNLTTSLDGFDDTFIKAAHYVGHRIKLSNMYWLYDGLDFRAACRDLYRMVDAYVTEVRSRGEERRRKTAGTMVTDEEELDSSASKATNVIEEMESHGAAQRDIVDQVMHLLVAGMDTSAAALGWTFSMLAEHPDKYERLHREVVSVFGTEEAPLASFELETLKTCTYLQHCFLETLRLFPAGPVNVREAVRDTVLPVGGGPDGKGPVAVKKGARVQMGTYLIHRRKDIWGPDADDFRPERWEGRRRGWEYHPFSGGPQICIGQGYSMTQVTYFIARMAMRYDRIEPAKENNNLKRGWMTVLTPGDGVRVRLHLARESKA